MRVFAVDFRQDLFLEVSRFLCSPELGFGSFPGYSDVRLVIGFLLAERPLVTVQLLHDSLAQVGQVIILRKPAVLDTLETNAPTDGPIASRFASLGRS